MTEQRDDWAIQRFGDDWRITSIRGSLLGHGDGGQMLHVLDGSGKSLAGIDLAEALDGFRRFADWTTAGMMWDQQALGYFADLRGMRHFVVRAWWGSRLVVALDDYRPVDGAAFEDELRAIESAIILSGLERLVAEPVVADGPTYDRSTPSIHATIDTLVHVPGLLGLREAVPLLSTLEERLDRPAYWNSSMRFLGSRVLVQTSLRRLGERPRCHPVTQLLANGWDEPVVPRYEGPVQPVDGPARHERLAEIERGTSVAEVHRLLGGPDYVERGNGCRFWRYEVDADEPYTLAIWLNEADDLVERLVLYSPPFWLGPELFPSDEHSVIDHDGSTVVSYIADVENGTFAGYRMDVQLLRGIASSGRYPAADLARSALDGDTSVLPPLADALEDAGDPAAAELRAGFPKGAVTPE